MSERISVFRGGSFDKKINKVITKTVYIAEHTKISAIFNFYFINFLTASDKNAGNLYLYLFNFGFYTDARLLSLRYVGVSEI